MKRQLAALVALAFVLAACGVKTDLDLPSSGKPTPKGQHDPSRPTSPVGQ